MSVSQFEARQLPGIGPTEVLNGITTDFGRQKNVVLTNGTTPRSRKAEGLLNEALVADVTYGPAHNSLGMVYYAQNKLYLAAWEFEYAAKLMPDLAEPYNNLGLVYERAT